MNLILSFIFIGLTLATQMAFTCFITNCPPGGKRSLSDRPTLIKQCQRCGPMKVGQCFGPRICCGPGIGCQIDNIFSKVCRLENLSARPCHLEGTKCGRSGVCASDGLCCEADRCFEEGTCRQEIRNQKVKTCHEEESGQFELSKMNREVAGIDGDSSFGRILPNLFDAKNEAT